MINVTKMSYNKIDSKKADIKKAAIQYIMNNEMIMIECEDKKNNQALSGKKRKNPFVLDDTLYKNKRARYE
jgi:hypothetical protein